MSVQVREFGTTALGQTVHLYRITNQQGAYVDLLDYGCTLHTVCVPDKDGKLTDVCLGYGTLAEYEVNDGGMGAVIGRCANRIRDGKFLLNGEEITLTANAGPHHLHGGIHGFDKKVWGACVASNRVIFTRTSPHGEEGYPGNFILLIRYSFDDSNVLTLEYDGISDEDTAVNLTNHCYFHLDGHGAGNVKDLVLQIHADFVTETDAEWIPTGNLLPVDGTDLDFRAPKPLGRDMTERGYDHNFVLRGEGFREVAELSSSKTGIVMTVRTTQPGMQLYSAEYLTDRQGKDGAEYGLRGGICLETQHFPDAVHQESFPSVILKQGEEYHQMTQYVFTTK